MSTSPKSVRFDDDTLWVSLSDGRIMLRRLHQLGDCKMNFAFESTVLSRTFAPFLQALKAKR